MVHRVPPDYQDRYLFYPNESGGPCHPYMGCWDGGSLMCGPQEVMWVTGRAGGRGERRREGGEKDGGVGPVVLG